MATAGGYYYGFWEENPRLWDRCLAEIKKQMLEQGWNKHAGKFLEVQLRRARKLFVRTKNEAF